jgi:hypothetical protein
MNLMKERLVVARSVNKKLDLEAKRIFIANCFEGASFTEEFAFLLCVIVIGLVAIHIYPIDMYVLAQVTIIPGTEDEESDDVDDDDGSESEETADGTVEEETISSPSGEVAGTPFQSSFADTLTGSPQITQSMNYSHFIPLTNSPGDQLKVIVDYNTVDPSIQNQPINVVMEVFSLSNQSLIKTSSFPDPVLANASGTVQLATSFPDNAVTEVVSLITFTDAEKGKALSEPLTLTVQLGESSTASFSG